MYPKQRVNSVYVHTHTHTPLRIYTKTQEYRYVFKGNIPFGWQSDIGRPK